MNLKLSRRETLRVSPGTREFRENLDRINDDTVF